MFCNRDLATGTVEETKMLLNRLTTDLGLAAYDSLEDSGSV